MTEERNMEILREIVNILSVYNGFTDNDFLMAGVTPYELLHPNEDTLTKMREYHNARSATKHEVTGFGL